MSGTSPETAVETFYQTHPISEQQILDKLTAAGKDLGALTEDILMQHDQDHYGGLPVNDILADRAEITAGSAVLDVCCGLGGPARYLAQRIGCHVTGIDLTDSRVEGARRLSAMVGLADKVEFVCCNALALPFDGQSFDVVISQEAFGHVPQKDRLIAECVRVLKLGGRIAFTDILATPDTTDATRVRLADGMTFNELATADSYCAMLEGAGCVVERVEDLGPEWRAILIDRLAMYRSLRGQTVDQFGQDHYDRWDTTYSHFVGCYSTGQLSGGRFVARRED